MATTVEKSKVLEVFGYLRSMSTRLNNLEKTAKEISKHIDDFTLDVDIKKQALTKEFKIIRDDVSSIQEEVRSVQKVILNLIEQLKTSVKKEEMVRFKKRMDLWSPENLLTRREVEKALKGLS